MENLFYKLELWLATQLDKLKVASPYIFLLVVLALGGVVKLFIDNKINIPTPTFIVDVFDFLGLSSIGIVDFDSVVIVLLTGLLGIVGPRTTLLKSKYRKMTSV